MADDAAPRVLTGTALKSSLDGLQGWAVQKDGAIARTFKFKDFSQAFGFMTRVALLAEKAGHHPDWKNSYNSVEIALFTHDKQGVTQKDIALAKAIDGL